MATYNVNQPSLGRLASFKIDYARLRAMSLLCTETGAGLPRMKEIVATVAEAINVPAQFIEVVLNMECSYPEEKTYKSSMPRLGDESKSLPDPNFPNPSEWAASLPQYRKGAKVNKGAQLYIGITQISWGFWQDVTGHAPMKTARIMLPTAWWTASLYWQIAAPFIYLDRYRSKFPSTTELVPSVVYALHQQGPGGIQDGLKKIAGKQSDKTPRVIKAAQHALRGERPAVYI